MRSKRVPAGVTSPSNDDIRRMAKARVAFRQHVVTYMVVNVFLIAVWWFDIGRDGRGSYWPIWVHLGWGMGLAFNWWGVYGRGHDAIAREEEKIRRELGREP